MAGRLMRQGSRNMVQRANRNRSRGKRLGFSRTGEKEQLMLQQEVLGNQGLHAADSESFENHEQAESENHEYILHGRRV